MGRSWIILAVAALLGVLQGQEGRKRSADDARREMEQRAREDVRRLRESTSLLWDYSTLRTFADLSDEGVLKTLVALYKKPPRPEPHLRYLIATLIGCRYDPVLGGRLWHAPYEGRSGAPSDQDIRTLRDFAEKVTKRESESWGAFNAFLALLDCGLDRDEILRIAEREKKPLRRIAAIEALAQVEGEGLPELLPALLADKQRKKASRAALVESAAWAAADWCRPRLVPDSGVVVTEREQALANTMVEKLVDVMRDKKHLPRTKRIARLALQRALRAERAFPDPETWEAIISAPGRSASIRGETVLSFMGIPTTGTRIVFLLDASDSMLNPLSEEEKEELESLLWRRLKPREQQDIFRIDWDRVENRFDAAREHLRFTLSLMDDSIEFAVILFGDDATLLSETPGLVRATEARRRAVVYALDQIVPGEKSDYRKYGTLHGQTNVLGAFDLGFRLYSGGFKETEPQEIDRDLLEYGADTFFLLSDGKPTRDGFTGRTPVIHLGGYWREAYEGETVDPETGEKREVKWDREYIPERTQSFTYVTGPYAQTWPLLSELARRNFYRKAVFHAIGIGEADPILPRKIAQLGRGRYLDLGHAEE